MYLCVSNLTFCLGQSCTKIETLGTQKHTQGLIQISSTHPVEGSFSGTAAGLRTHALIYV